MTRSRRRLRFRIVLVAIMALLWSQLVLAGHAGCLFESQAARPASVAMDHGCSGSMPSSDQPLCAAHCSNGEASTDSGRIPPVPPMLAVPAIPLISIIVIAHGGDGGVPARIHSSPPPSWHRPTSHPAALLLI